MKRLVVLMSLLLSLGGVVAAEGTAPQYRYGSRGYFGTARANVQTMSAFWFNDPAVGVDLINGYSFNPWFMLGGGVGFIYTCVPGEGAVRIPIYLHLRANVLDRKVTPFFSLNLGGGFCKGYQPGLSDGAAEEPNGHYWFSCIEPQVGVAVYLKNGRMIDFGASIYLDAGRGLNGGLKFGIGFTW